jgi:type II secretory pathway pseudopilin PulG
MCASLVEMVLAIVIAGLIFASAIIPTTQSAVAYQEAEADVREATWQATATVRTEQLVGSIWRDDEPPAGHEALTKAQASQLSVDNCELRQTADAYQQNVDSIGWSVIASPVQSFGFQYLLNDGSWASSVSGGQHDDVLAVRFDWSSSDNGRKCGGVAVAPDRAFSGGRVNLLEPDTSAPYSRSDYERTIAFALGSWQ